MGSAGWSRRSRLILTRGKDTQDVSNDSALVAAKGLLLPAACEGGGGSATSGMMESRPVAVVYAALPGEPVL